ncbi:heparinase II/III family protein [Pseudooceanicola sp.]|uniref:heparinase II/III family protein n=1 Tax=Pseudooceanicola sp. TaxID=1914328 RepID=UPI0026029B84|nr:heparinase II/III family protein [Pseudooceanicola sp.]MDF1856678.1 heparinase II/III family protein [Pseudooceanicola sp.]
MTRPESTSARRGRFMDRLHARLSVLARPATGFVSQPEPRSVGSFAKGRQLMVGNFLFAGYLVADPDHDIWDLEMPEQAFEEEIHGFTWLDDLAAVGDTAARARAQAWLWAWITRYGRGRGPGWAPDLAGRRLIRWISHALFLLRAQEPEASHAFYRSLGQQTIFLGRRWKSAAPGLPRFEALTGLIYAGLSLEGMERFAAPAIRALGRECVAQVDEQGGIPTRNPEELLEVFTLLTWAAAALAEAGREVTEPHREAIWRIAPTLRTLRHADGGLARFHGGGKGLEGRLDQALAASGVKSRHSDGLAMGYARISAGRTSVIIDASPPPVGKASFNAHASTLAFELTSGRRPLIVNCGSGVSFGPDWRRAGRATPSHTTLSLDGRSTGRLTEVRGFESREMLVDAPQRVPIRITHASDGIRFEGGHDGYVKPYGLTHARQLELTFDGRGMAGEDMLLALEEPDKKRFDKAMDAVQLGGIPFQLRFHLHPEVDTAVDLGGSAVSMALRSGEIWIFRHDGRVEMSLDASVFLEKNRLKPRATKQIVLSGRAMEYATRIRWSLSKAQETPISIRDLAPDEADMSA